MLENAVNGWALRGNKFELVVKLNGFQSVSAAGMSSAAFLAFHLLYRSYTIGN